jgi:hypothetical protein
MPKTLSDQEIPELHEIQAGSLRKLSYKARLQCGATDTTKPGFSLLQRRLSTNTIAGRHYDVADIG